MKPDEIMVVCLTIGELRALIRDEVQPVVNKPAPLLVDTAGAAERLSLPASWVAAAARRGEIPAVRCGHHVRFRIADLEEFLSRTNGKKG